MKYRNYVLALLFLLNIPIHLSGMDHGKNLKNAGQSLTAAWHLAQSLSSPNSAALALAALAAAGAGTARWLWPQGTPTQELDAQPVRAAVQENEEGNAAGDNRLALVPVARERNPDWQDADHLVLHAPEQPRLTPEQQMFLLQLMQQLQTEPQRGEHPLLLLPAPPELVLDAGEPTGNVGAPAFAAPATAHDWQRAQLFWQTYAYQHAPLTYEDRLAQQAFWQQLMHAWQQLQARHSQSDKHHPLALPAPQIYTDRQPYGANGNGAGVVDEHEQVGTEMADLYRWGKLLQKTFDQWLETAALQSEQRRLAQQEKARIKYLIGQAEYHRIMQIRKGDRVEQYLAPPPQHPQFRGQGHPPKLNKNGKRILHGAYDLYSSNVGSKNPAFTLRKLLRQDASLHGDFLALNEISSSRALCTTNIYTHGRTSQPRPPKHEPYHLTKVVEHLVRNPRYHAARG